MSIGVHSGNRAPKRNKTQKEIDRDRISHLLRRGWTQVEIAKELGLHQTQISYDYKIIKKRRAAQREEDEKELIDSKLEEYREVKREAWQAWERSKENSKKVVEESILLRKKGDDSEDGIIDAQCILRKVKEILTTEGRLPANEYLNTILKCLAGERELQGLDAAKEVNVRAAVATTSIDFDAIAGPVPDMIEADIQAILSHRPRPSACSVDANPEGVTSYEDELEESDNRDQVSLPEEIGNR